MEKFVDQILSDHRGQIIICNILDGLDEGLYNKDFICKLLDWWKVLYSHMGGSKSTLLSTLNALVFNQMPIGFRKGIIKPNFRLICCRKTRVINDDTELTTVIPVFVFKFIIHKKDMDRLHSQGVEFPSDEWQPWNEEAINSLMNLPDAHRKIRIDAGKTISKHLLWYTIKKGFENALLKGTDYADQVRDALGLVHHEQGKILIALHLSGNALKYVNSGRPTFSDAGIHKRFKTRADKLTNKQRKAWGHTADLGHFASGKPCVDGLPERIAEPIGNNALIDSPEVHFTPLGKVKMSRGNTVNDNDQCFVAHLLKSRSVDKLKQTILSIL